MALALTRPAEVENFIKGLKNIKMYARYVRKSDVIRQQGFRDGKKFQPTKAISGGE